MIRPIRNTDKARLKELENGYAWELDQTFVQGLVFVDEQDRPVIFAGAWKKVEVHLAIDGKWGTPGMRFAALKELHEAMRRDLRDKGFDEAITWFEDVKDRFIDRLQSWGWVKSNLTSWHKQL